MYTPCDCGMSSPPGCPCDIKSVWNNCVVTISGITNAPCDDSSFHIYHFHFCNFACDVDFSIINGAYSIKPSDSPCGKSAFKLASWVKSTFYPTIPFSDSICIDQTYVLNITCGIHVNKAAQGYDVSGGITLFPVVNPIGIGLCVETDVKTKTVNVVNCGDPVSFTFNLVDLSATGNCGSTYSYRALRGPASVTVAFS